MPILAFGCWVLLLLYYFPFARLELPLAEELLAPQLFISFLILVYAWALSGPVTAAILTTASALVVFYVCLGARDPSIFLQILLYGGLFAVMFTYLFDLQKTLNNKEIDREKLQEDIHLAAEETEKKIALKKALDQKIERFLGFRQFSETLKDVPDLEGSAVALIDEVRKLVPKAEECALYLVDEAKQELYLVAGSSVGGEAVREKQGSIFDQWAMKRSQALMIEDTRNDFRFSTERRESDSRLISIAASPLMTENRVLGVLRVSASRAGQFSSDDLRLVDILASLGAVTLRNRLLYERMGELAIRDSLTGLYLNRYFQERINEEIARSSLKESHFSLIMLDIDYFKHVNDEFGHTAGDLVLKSVASIIQGCLNPVDLAARYGGEEFVILCPNESQKSAMERAEHLRASIEKNRFYLRRSENRVTASFGVAAYPKDGKTKEELIQAVDRRLYHAKRMGRNRVCGNTSS